MKRLFSGILSAVVVSAGIAVAGSLPAQAQQAESTGLPLKVGLVDFGRVLRESDAGKDLNAKFDVRLTEIRAEVQKIQNELQEKRKAIEAERDFLSPEALQKKVEDWKREAVELEKTTKVRKSDIEELRKVGIAQIRSELNKVIGSIAAEKRITLMLRADRNIGAVLFGVEEYVINQEALSRLNESLKTVDLSKIQKQ